MQLTNEQLRAFGSASHCASLQDILDLIRASPSSSEIRKYGAACGMALYAAQAVRITMYFEDSRFVVDELSRAKAEIDIVGWHHGDITSVTTPILMATQQFLDKETIGCNDWPSPEEVATVAICAAIAQAAS